MYFYIDAFRQKPFRQNQLPVEILKVSKRKWPIACFVGRYKLFEIIRSRYPVLCALQTEIYFAFHAAIVLHDLDENELDVVLPVVFALAQTQVLNPKTALSVGRRNDAAIKRYSITLFLYFFLKIRQARFYIFVGFPVNVPVRLEERDFLFECADLLLERRDPIFVIVPFLCCIDHIVIGLNSAKLKRQVTADDQRDSNSGPHGPHVPAVVPV
jgi:hypothetical protein